MATTVMARRTGMFRCTGLGQTKYARAGEELPAHDSCPGGCEWQFNDKGNLRPEKATVIIRHHLDGPSYVLIIEEVPKVGDTIDLRVGLNGNFRVTKVDTITSHDYLYPRILVEYVGDYKEELVYAVGLVEL